MLGSMWWRGGGPGDKNQRTRERRKPVGRGEVIHLEASFDVRQTLGGVHTSTENRRRCWGKKKHLPYHLVRKLVK